MRQPSTLLLFRSLCSGSTNAAQVTENLALIIQQFRAIGRTDDDDDAIKSCHDCQLANNTRTYGSHAIVYSMP